MDARLDGETEFHLYPELFTDLQPDAFYLVPVFFSAGYPAGWCTLLGVNPDQRGDTLFAGSGADRLPHLS